MSDLNSKFATLDKKLNLILSILSTIQNTEVIIMASFTEIEAAIETGKAATAAEAIEVQAALAAQSVEIQSLKDQIAALASTSSITAEQAEALLVSANSLTASVSGIYTPVVA